MTMKSNEEPVQRLYSFITARMVDMNTGKGHTIRSWVKARITRSLDRIAGTGSLELQDVQGNDYSGMVESPIVITLHMRDREDPNYREDRKVMTGYVRSLQDTRGQDKTTIQITVADNTIDLTECYPLVRRVQDGTDEGNAIPFLPGKAPIKETPSEEVEPVYQNKTLAEICTAMCEPFGIPVVDYAKDETPFEIFTVEETTTVWKQIAKLCNQRGVLAYTNEHGELVLGNLGYTTDGFDNSTLGDSTLRSGRVETWRQGQMYTFVKTEQYKHRFSHYRTKTPITTNGSWEEEYRILRNRTSRRFRPKVLQIRNEQKGSLNNLALWKSQTDFGQSLQCEGHFTSWNRWNKYVEGRLLDPYVHFPGQRVNLNMTAWGYTTPDWIKTEVTYEISGTSSRNTKVVLRPASMYAKLKKDESKEIAREDLVEKPQTKKFIFVYDPQEATGYAPVPDKTKVPDTPVNTPEPYFSAAPTQGDR